MQRGELSERWDPAMSLFLLKVTYVSYETVKLRHLLLTRPQYGANERGIERETFEQPRYIRITDIDNYGSLSSELGMTAEAIDKKYFLENNDLLIARSGNTVGKSYLHKSTSVSYDCFFAGYLLRFKINPNMVMPDFVFLWTQLSYYKQWIAATQRPTGQPNINAEEYSSLPIPIPDSEIQEEMVSIYMQGVQKLNQKQAKAQLLLDSIDSYLQGELGIKLPPEPENSIQSRMFRTTSKELSGWRFDARVHNMKFDLSSKKYPMRALKDLVLINPRTRLSQFDNDDVLSFVPMEAISDEDGTITNPQTRKAGDNQGYTTFKENDLLWSKITPCMENGKSAIAGDLLNGYGFGSTEYHVLRSMSKKLNINYVHALLRLKRLRKAAMHYFGGSAGHQRVDEAFLKRLEIPLPPIKKQNEIAEHINDTKEEARKLKAEAEKELEQAKQKIERMLLKGGQQ